jgi:uncharacterized membrane protein (DUF373 family)
MSPSEIAGVPPRTRNWIARAFSLVEDVAYIGLGLLLAGCAIALLIDAVYGFMHQFATTSTLSNTVGLLDRILLILVVIELLYTVQVSFREHAVVPEPFLLVGVIAAIRRVLIITAEFSQARPLSETMFQHFVVELGILTLLIVALAISLLLLKKRETVAAVTKSDMAKR